MNAEGPTTPPGWFPTSSPPPPPDEPRHGRMLVVIVAAAVLVVAAVATGLVLLLSSDDDGDRRAQDEPATDTTSEPTDAPVSESTDVPSDEPERTQPERSPDPPRAEAARPTGQKTDEPTVVPDQDPADVTQRFVDAATAGDCATARTLVTRRLLRREGGCRSENLGAIEGVDISVGEAVVVGFGASVPVTLEISDADPGEHGDHESPEGEFTFSVHLIAQGDQWKIDDFGQEGGMQ